MEHLLARRAAGATSSVIRDLLRLVEQPGVLSLAGGLPAASSFPAERLRLAAERALAAGGRYGVASLQYGPTEGDEELRTLAAARLGASAGEVLVTTGSQQGLDLVARALLDPGDVVVVESPSYVGGLQALRACEPRFVEVRIDGGGLRTDDLETALAGGLRPKLLYTIPNFQNPSGATLALERRRHLAALADRFGFVVLEDDPYGSLRFRGQPLADVRSWSDRVVTLGTASKLLAPGLRVAWLAAPAWLMGPLVRLKQAADLHTSTLAQRIVADVLADDGFLSAHVAQVSDTYRERCDVLAAAVSGVVDVTLPDGGMFLWGRIWGGGIDAAGELARAVAAGVAYVPGAAFSIRPSWDDAVRLSFATLEPDDLREAARRLAAVFAERDAPGRSHALLGTIGPCQHSNGSASPASDRPSSRTATRSRPTKRT